MFPLAMFMLPEIFRSSPSRSFRLLSRKSSASFFFLSVGDVTGTEPGILFSKPDLLTLGVPTERL